MSFTYPFPVKFSNIDPGITMAWSDEGQGNGTLIFIHGLAGYMPLWQHQVDELKADYRCIRVDLPGNGISPGGDYPYSLYFYAEILARFIQKEKLDKVCLCGHSMGGHIALILAMRYPFLVDKLILIAPSGIESFTPHEIMLMENMISLGQLFYTNTDHIESTIRHSFYRRHPEAVHIIRDLKEIIRFQSPKQWNTMITALIRSMLKEQMEEFMKGLRVPSLILFGERDGFIPNRMIHPYLSIDGLCRLASDKIPGSEVHCIQGAGHFLQIEKYGEVNRFIDLFLRK